MLSLHWSDKVGGEERSSLHHLCAMTIDLVGLHQPRWWGRPISNLVSETFLKSFSFRTNPGGISIEFWNINVFSLLINYLCQGGHLFPCVYYNSSMYSMLNVWVQELFWRILGGDLHSLSTFLVINSSFLLVSCPLWPTFDTIAHGTLTNLLENQLVSLTVLNWFKTYIRGRKFYVIMWFSYCSHFTSCHWATSLEGTMFP